jgi:hypothetical protein
VTDFAPDAVLTYDEQIRRYAQVHARLMGNPAQKRVNKPTREPEVRSEPVVEIVEVARRPLDIAGTMREVVALAVAASPVSDAPPEPHVSTRSIRFVLDHVAAFYGVTVMDMLSDRREQDVIWPRHIAMHLARKFTLKSFPEIGRHFGGRDHTTVLSGATKIERAQESNELLRGEIAELTRRIEAKVVPGTLPATTVRSRPRRMYRQRMSCREIFWNEDRNAQLASMWMAGMPPSVIGEHFGGRSRKVINERARLIGLPSRLSPEWRNR